MPPLDKRSSPRLGDQYVGQNVDALVIKFGPPASTFKMNSGDTSYIWQLGNQTNINTDRGAGIASTQYCKVSVVANKTGVISQLNTEDSNYSASHPITNSAGTAGTEQTSAIIVQALLILSADSGHPPLFD